MKHLGLSGGGFVARHEASGDVESFWARVRDRILSGAQKSIGE
jgi:hypothetical protein